MSMMKSIRPLGGSAGPRRSGDPASSRSSVVRQRGAHPVGSAVGCAHRRIQVVQLDTRRDRRALVSLRVDLHDRLIALGSHDGIRCGAPRHRLLGWDAVASDVEVAIAILDNAHRPTPAASVGDWFIGMHGISFSRLRSDQAASIGVWRGTKWNEKLIDLCRAQESCPRKCLYPPEALTRSRWSRLWEKSPPSIDLHSHGEMHLR